MSGLDFSFFFKKKDLDILPIHFIKIDFLMISKNNAELAKPVRDGAEHSCAYSDAGKLQCHVHR